MVVSTASALVVANALAKGEYGAYALAAGLAGLLAATLDLGMTSSLARFVAQGRAEPGLVRGVLVLRGSFLLLGAAVLVVVQSLAGSDATRFVELLPAAAAVVLLQGMVAFLYGSLPAMRRIRLLLAITVLQPVVELVGVLVARAQGADATGMLLAGAAGAAVGALLGYVALALDPRGIQRSAPHAVAVVERREVLRYGRAVFLVTLLVLVFGQVDQFVIAAFHGEGSVAPYALAIKLQALLAAPAITATGIVAPRIAGGGTAALAMYRQWMAFGIVLYLGAVGVFAVLAPELFGAINPDYREDWPLLLALLPFMLLVSIANLPSVTLNQIGEAGSRARIAGVTLAIDVVLDLLLVPWLEGYGAAIATTTAFAYYLARHHRLVEGALAREQSAPAPSMRPTLLRGIVLAAATAGLAALLRPAAAAVASGRSEAVVVVLVAAGIPAVVHVLATSRLTHHADSLRRRRLR